MAKIKIVAEHSGVTMTAELNNSQTAKELWEELPMESSAQTWGDEVYFEIPLRLPAEDAQADVPSGAVAYWPPGHAFCIFFGQTPYSPVNPLGTLDGDAKEFAKVNSGEKIRLERA